MQAPLPHAFTVGALSAPGELKKALAGARAGFLDAGNGGEKRREKTENRGNKTGVIWRS